MTAVEATLATHAFQWRKGPKAGEGYYLGDAKATFVSVAGKALPLREKELINVALAIAGQCDWCIAVHVKHAIDAGASRDEIVESGFMAVIMHGGPALMYLIPLLEAVDEFLPTGE